MCGIFGYATHDDEPVHVSTLQRIAEVTMRRGPHAWGLAWIDRRGTMHCYKQQGRIVDNLGLLAMARGARYLIGHCRYATDGHPAHNINNHPHDVDGGWLVHNGVIPDWRTAIHEHNLHCISSCDSEVIARLYERSKGRAEDRLWNASHIAGDRACCILGLWKPGTLVAVKRGNPLSVGVTKRGHYLASLRPELPGRVWDLDDEETYVYGLDD